MSPTFSRNHFQRPLTGDMFTTLASELRLRGSVEFRSCFKQLIVLSGHLGDFGLHGLLGEQRTIVGYYANHGLLYYTMTDQNNGHRYIHFILATAFVHLVTIVSIVLSFIVLLDISDFPFRGTLFQCLYKLS